MNNLFLSHSEDNFDAVLAKYSRLQEEEEASNPESVPDDEPFKEVSDQDDQDYKLEEINENLKVSKKKKNKKSGKKNVSLYSNDSDFVTDWKKLSPIN